MGNITSQNGIERSGKEVGAHRRAAEQVVIERGNVTLP